MGHVTLKKEDWLELPKVVRVPLEQIEKEAEVLGGRFVICCIGDRWCAVRVDWYDFDTTYSM